MVWSDKKQAVFDEAVRQFSERGYHAVTIREITDALKINSSVIYVHFQSKEDILNEILNAFEKRITHYLLTKERVDVYIETDTPRRLLERCVQNFKPDENEFMTRAFRIVCMEMMTNPRAMDLIVRRIHREPAQSIQYTLDKLIERGKIPAFDTRLFSDLWVQYLFSEAVIWLGGVGQRQQEQITSKAFYELGDFLIDMAISGKISR